METIQISINKWINKLWYFHTVEHYSAINRNELLLYITAWICCRSITQWCSLFATPWTAADQTPLSITNSQSFSNSYPLSQWCHPTTSSSVVPFSSCPQSFSASGSFLMSQLFASGGQSTGASASAAVLPVNVQDWFPLRLTNLISLQSKGLSRVFSNTRAQKHQFFSTQPSLRSNSHTHTWLPEKP